MSTNTSTMAPALATNMQRADQYLTRFRAAPVRHFIGGRSVDGGGSTFDNLNPFDNSVLCQVKAGNAETIARAVQAATDAFPAWRELDGHRRRSLLHEIANRIEQRAEEF